MALTRSRIVAPALAVALALVAILTGAQGVDLAAATYRVELFARSGLTLWDSQWYGGHWTFNYSVLFAPIGWLTGIPVMEVICVALAAWAFDRLAVGRFGRGGRIAAIAFAVGTVVQVAIGQEPYLLGETLGLLALVIARAGGRWRPLAGLLAIACALASPLAGGFLALAVVSWMIGTWPVRRWELAALAAAAGLPVILLQAVFPGQGTMPFAPLNFIGMLIALVPIGMVVARRDRAISAGVVLYGAAVVFSFAVPSEIGNNITRLGVCFGLALVVGLAWEHRRGRVLLAAAAVPLALGQWAPAAGPLLGWGNASMRVAYFQPLLGFLRTHDAPLGRVEVVPTALHWEAAYVAPYYPLARGWERQLDTANNKIFYQPGKLTPESYRSWLFANGVRFVALPDVPLDYAAKDESRIVRGGVPGLTPVWHSAHWRVYRVSGAPGLVSGPARLVRSDGDHVVIDATRAGTLIVRERYVPAWHIAQGHATITKSASGWLRVRVTRPGRVELRIEL